MSRREVAQVPDGSCSYLMADGVPVVTAPAETDVGTAGQPRAMPAEQTTLTATPVLDQMFPHFTGAAQTVAQAPDGRVRPRGPRPSPGMRSRAERNNPAPGGLEERN